MLSFIVPILYCLCSYSQGDINTRDYQVDVENEAVRGYMEEVVYEPHDRSQINNYRSGLSYRPDWPNAVVMDIPECSSDSIWIYCCDDETSKDSLTFHIATKERQVKLYNFIPKRVYRYEIKNGHDVLQQGKIRTHGQLRMINVCDAVNNVRDLGGWKTADSMQIRYGKIIRGSELNGLHIATDEGIDVLLGLGIGSELDLRASYDEDHNVSAFDFSTSSGFESVATYYYTSDSGQLPSQLTNSRWLNKWQLEFRFIVRNLRLGRTVYTHCVYGKDRTGFLCFLLEGLLGVSYSDMVKDYELTFFVSPIESTKDSIDKVYDYINTMEGETLRDKFNTFFVEELGAEQEDIDYFRSEMLESIRRDDEDDNAIRDIQENIDINKESSLYDLNGRRLRTIRNNGLYIIRDQKGHTRKVFYQ